ncbi:WG repeat-containing protein [Aquimarina sp. MMG016]|uniref:WG repeat-containing protein n=1 Tax=Aquimarina sp. MMG016 TaxID=2822690 RepID=UPI001B3A4765|nr:WG repeat-containing protein [Aquimarina sp. MMG016]MBQ4819682.1 WG repeat-containing protein [Aquimarina sp. MMG016]
MKSILILMISLIALPYAGSAQVIEGIDQITPFHEDLAAVKKGEKWAFINTKGEIVIDYRDDLVWSSYYDSKSKKKKIKKEPVEYPVFNEGKCLIKKMTDGITYYGYIDKTGKTVIQPEYLNAIPFNQGHAIVLKVSKEELGKNELLDKKVVSYSYDEIVINSSGDRILHLKGPEHIILTKDKMKWPPAIESYLISPNLAVAKTKDDNWKLFPLITSNQKL